MIHFFLIEGGWTNDTSTVWNEFQHERTQEKVKEIYPDGIHTCIAKFLRQEEELSVRTAVFDEKEHGLTEEVLANTDVLVFWNHMLQEEFSDMWPSGFGVMCWPEWGW